MSQNNDLISRRDVIDALHTWFRDGFDEDKWWNSTHVLAAIEGLPSAQQGYKWEESGLKEQLADDSDSYDSLLPTVQPEVIRCKDCEHWKNEHLCERLSRFGSFETKADFYCGYAERKINERTG